MPNSGRQLGLFLVIVADLIGLTLAGLGLGYLAWKRWGAPMWVALVTGAAGFGLGIYRVYGISRKVMNE